MEEGLSSLQLIPSRDIQSPTVTSHQEASTEEQQRRRSSALGPSAEESAEQHQRPETTEEQPRRMSAEEINRELVELRRLRRLAEDLNRHLEQQTRSTVHGNDPGSGFYPARHVEQGGPLTTGTTIEREAQRPEVRLYSHQGNAYGADPNGAGFYGYQGNASSIYPYGMQNMPRSEAYLYGRLDNAYGAYPNGVQHLSPEVQMMDVNRVLVEQPQAGVIQPADERRPATGKSVVQFCDATPGRTVARPSPESWQNTAVKTPAEQTPEGGTTELEPVGTVYHTARMKRDDSNYREEPSTEPELRTKQRKVVQYDSEDSEDDDVSEQRHRKERAETDAKAGVTRRPSRHLNGTSKRAIDPAGAKVGLTQHSPPQKSNSSSQNVRSRTADRTSRRKKRQSTSAPRSTSTEGRRRDQRKSASPKETKEDESYSPSDASIESSSEDESVTSPKHMLKPPKFDGQSSFETFMAQFSNCAEYNKWNETQKLAHLHNSLEKEAAYILWDYGKDATGCLAGLMKILETRFGGKAMADKHRIELQNRQCRADEKLQSVHSDIRRLTALAYPNVSPEMREEVTCDHFLDALGDSYLVFKIRQQQPADLDSALWIALQLEVWAKETIRHRGTSKSEKGNGRRVREISNKKPDPAVELLQKEVEGIKKYVGFEHGVPRNPNGGIYTSSYRQPVGYHLLHSARVDCILQAMAIDRVLLNHPMDTE